jgi:uncharacterized membrane protein YkvA (DUF1232 family)
MSERLRVWARTMKNELTALSMAARDPRTPWYAKLVVLCVVGYALSPIDLIPDPIPVLGYLDDVVLLPLGIALAIKLIPRAVMTDSRSTASSVVVRPSRAAAIIIVTLWIALAVAGFWLLRIRVV